MSKLDEVLKALNKLLGGSAVQRASELVKSADILLHEDENKGEKIPPRPESPRPAPKPKKRTDPSVSFFENDTSTAGRYVPPSSRPVRDRGEKTPQGGYRPINVRRQDEPLYRIQYQKLRRIGLQYSQLENKLYAPGARRFYEQAKYIQTLTDRYEEDEPFEGWYFSYMDLSIRQFRRYVTLHPQMLSKDYSFLSEKNVGYLALYISELICGAARPDAQPAEVFEEIEEIVRYLKTVEFSNDGIKEYDERSLVGWLFDYAVSCKLSEQALHCIKEYGEIIVQPDSLDDAVEAYGKNDFDTLLVLLSARCSYHICTTAVCKKEPYSRIYPQLFKAVLESLDQYFRSGKSMEDRLFGIKFVRAYQTFPGTEARVNGMTSFTFELTPWRSYRYDELNAKYEVIAHLQLNADWIASVLRCMDYYFRLEVQTVKLKTSGMSSVSQERVIADAVHTFCEKHKLIGYETRLKQKNKKQKEAAKKSGVELPAAPVKVEFDLSKLDEIRKDSGEVEARLLSVYEEESFEAESVPQPEKSEEKPDKPLPAAKIVSRPEDEWTEFAAALSDEQRKYLALLLHDKQSAAVCLEEIHHTAGILPQLILEQINETALSIIGDTVMKTEGEIGIFEDYGAAAAAVFLI